MLFPHIYDRFQPADLAHYHHTAAIIRQRRASRRTLRARWRRAIARELRHFGFTNRDFLRQVRPS